MDELLRGLSENPDTIDSYTTDQVAEARAAIRQFTADVRSGEITADAAALAEAQALTARLTARDETLTAERAEFDAAIDALEASVAETETPEVEVEVEADEVAVVETVIDGNTVETPADPELEAVAASATPPTIGALAARIPADRRPQPTRPALVASAGGNRAGQRFDSRTQFGQSMMDAWKGSGIGRFTVASLDTRSERELTLTDSPAHNAQVLEEVARRASEHGNLVASGGFCAPAEVTYGFFNIASRAGILGLPTVGAPRGAVQYPVSPSIADFIGENGIAGVWTNSTDITPGEATKAVFTVDCPTFAECEVAAYATILQFGNFGSRFYPENVANSTGLAMIAAERVINAAAIAALQGFAVASTVGTLAAGALANLSQVLAVQGADYRQTYGMDPEAPLDVVAPAWLPRALWADAIARDSTVEYGDIRRRIAAMFGELDLRPQWVYDYQNLASEFFPNTVDVMMMAPATAVKLDAGTLDLGVVRDSTLNSTNDYQTFAEEFVGWCMPGHEVREVNDIDICPTGGTGDRVTIDCAVAS